MSVTLKLVVEKHADGFVAYPLGLNDVVLGEGDTYEEALADVKSALTFYFKNYGSDQLSDTQPLEAYMTDLTVEVA
jgi:predicted RNase H-like HicB family nuclease